MSKGWTLGAPPIQKHFSDVVEVTDGDHVARGRVRLADASGIDPWKEVWFHEDGSPLGWQPTHWRPAAPRPAPATFEVD